MSRTARRLRVSGHEQDRRRQANLLRHVHIVRTRDAAVAKSGYFGRVVWKDGCPPR